METDLGIPYIKKTYYLKWSITAVIVAFSFCNYSQSYKQLKADYKIFQEQGNSERQFETARLLVEKHKDNLVKDPVWYAEINAGFGNYYYLRNNFDSAIYCYSRAVNQVYSVKADTSFDYGFYLYNLAAVSGAAGYYEKAEQYYQYSLPILSKFLGQSSLEYTLYYKAYVEMKIDMGDYQTATPLNDALLYYFKTLKGETNTYYLICLNNKARISQGQGNYEEASSLFLQALRANQQYNAHDTLSVTALLNNVAECYRMMGNYNDAEPLYLNALHLEERCSKIAKDGLASLYNNMGLLYKSKSDYSKAEKYFLKSIDFYKAVNYQNTMAFTNPLNNIGDLYRLIGNYKSAVAYTERAVEIRKFTSGENHEYYANALTNLALLKMEFNYLDEAEEELLQCEKIYRAKLGEDNQRYAGCLSNLSSLYARKKNYLKALEYKKQCLNLMEKAGASQTDKYALYLSGKGAIECEIEDYKSAIESFDKASEIFKTNFGAQNFNYIDMQFSLANVNERIQNTNNAIRYYLTAMSGYKKIVEDNFVTMSEEEKNDFYYILSNRFETFYCFVINLTKKNPSFKNDSLSKMVLNVRLLDKSLLLNESKNINKAIATSNDTIIKSLFSDWIQQKKYLQELYKYSINELAKNSIDLENEENIKNTLEKKLSELSTTFKKTLLKEDLFLQIKNKLTQKDLAVEMIRTAVYLPDGVPQINYAALLIGKNYQAPKLLVLDSCAFFDTLFISFYKRSIEDTLTDKLSYTRFYAPIQKYTSGILNIYFSGDGVYQKLNLYTLLNPKTNNYLLESMEITQLTSLMDLLKTEEPIPSSNTASLFGFPDYELKSLSPFKPSETIASRSVFKDLPELPGTKKETEDITLLLKSKKWHPSLFLAEHATEEEIKKLKGPTILHIATHGFFLPDDNATDEKIMGFSTEQAKQNPLLRSGLIMAGASAAKDTTLTQQEDGILTAYEASLLNLQNTELVTLSACETGLGELVNGQGVYGLQRAFLTAGARAVIMSLWVVDDNATQELMTEFYINYLQETTRNKKRTALRTAQLEIKKRYPKPYYWGAFVLIGN